MKSLLGPIMLLFVSAISVITLVSTPVWAGGEAGDDAHDHDDGVNFFGFVKDVNGRAIPDAKVTADIKGLIKGRASVIARTNATGAYRIPGFGKEISPNNVTIPAAKTATSRPGHLSGRR